MKKTRRGPKPIYTERQTTMIDKATKRLLAKKADERRATESQLVREALVEFLAKA